MLKNPLTPEQIEEEEKAVHSLRDVFIDHINDNNIAMPTAVACLITLLAQAIMMTYPDNDRDQQDDFIKFLINGLKVNLVENNCRAPDA